MILLSLLALPALSAPTAAPTPATPHQAVEALYGKSIPEAAVCAAAPLPDAYSGAVPVAVKRGSRGCVLIGVLHDDRIVLTDAALPAAIGAKAWADADAGARTQWLEGWATGVWLAFVQLEGEVEVKAQATGAVVTATALHRTDRSGGSARSALTWTVGEDAMLTDESTQTGDSWTTQFFINPKEVSGLSTETLTAALETRGKLLKDCFNSAWERDLTTAGQVLLKWEVAEAKAADLAQVATGAEPVDHRLARCYAHTIRGIEFPDGTAGHVKMAFSAVRKATN